MDEKEIKEVHPSFITLANQLEKWIKLFWKKFQTMPGKPPLTYDSDFCQEATFRYIPVNEWRLVWIFIEKIRDTPDETRNVHGWRDFFSIISNLTSTQKRIYYYGSNDFLNYVLSLKLSTEILRPFILEFLTSFPSPFQLHPERENFYCINVLILPNYYEQTQNYFFLMKCLFQKGNDDFQSTDIFTSGTEPSQGKKNYLHCQWKLTEKAYQQCLELFPNWPLVMPDGWKTSVLKELKIQFIPELANVCVEFL